MVGKNGAQMAVKKPKYRVCMLGLSMKPKIAIKMQTIQSENDHNSQ